MHNVIFFIAYTTYLLFKNAMLLHSANCLQYIAWAADAYQFQRILFHLNSRRVVDIMIYHLNFLFFPFDHNKKIGFVTTF